MDRIHTPTKVSIIFFSVSLPYTRERGEYRPGAWDRSEEQGGAPKKSCLSMTYWRMEQNPEWKGKRGRICIFFYFYVWTNEIQ